MELIPLITEAEQSHDLLSANRRASGVNSSLNPKAGDPGEPMGSPTLREGEDQRSSSTVRQREQLLPYPTSCSVQALDRLDEAHPHWRAIFYLVHRFRCSSPPQTPSQIHPE